MDLRPRSILGRLGDLADRIDPDREPKDDDGQTDTAPDTEDTDAPASADTVPDRRPGAPRLPDWWAGKKPLSPDEPDSSTPRTFPAAKEDDGGEVASKEDCEHSNPHAVHAQPTGELVAYWCAECETQLEVPDAEDGEGEDTEDGDPVPSKFRKHWRRKGSGSRIYRRPAYLDSRPAPKQSLIQWWVGMDAPTRWLLYNGTALGIGFYFGVPQFFTAETAYLVHTYGSWTDWHVCIWYGVAVAVWALDARTRSWFPLFALAGRIPLISMVFGSLLYGSTDLEL
ncbi:hypothetical protein [Streptomyces smyrnaeus]|uniref:hypothetical protein n=1 Tax=Streptomyces smyrnaeus TaxID=1387713 RepID=UPI0036A82F66